MQKNQSQQSVSFNRYWLRTGSENKVVGYLNFPLLHTRDHITPVLTRLHWLPIKSRMMDDDDDDDDDDEGQPASVRLFVQLQLSLTKCLMMSTMAYYIVT